MTHDDRLIIHLLLIRLILRFDDILSDIDYSYHCKYLFSQSEDVIVYEPDVMK